MYYLLGPELTMFNRKLFLTVSACASCIFAFCQIVSAFESNMGILDRHRKLDAAASADHIKSETDALRYVNVLSGLYQFKEIEPQRLDSMKKKLAAAEWEAVSHQAAWITEMQVAAAFNKLVERYGHPEFKIGEREVHSERMRLSALYPHMFGRKPDGSIEPLCRPVEAVYVLFLLDFQAQFADDTRPTRTPGLSIDPVLSAHASEYRKARMQFLRTHSVADIEQAALDSVSVMGIALAN
jgi:hypothetical protein